jgi:hypothetical protein
MVKKLIYLAVILLLAQCGYSEGLLEDFESYPDVNMVVYNPVTFEWENVTYTSWQAKVASGGYTVHDDNDANIPWVYSWAGVVWNDQTRGVKENTNQQDDPNLYKLGGDDRVRINTEIDPNTKVLSLCTPRDDTKFTDPLDPTAGPHPKIAWRNLPADMQIRDGDKKTFFFRLRREGIRMGLHYVGLAMGSFAPHSSDVNEFFPWIPEPNDPNNLTQKMACEGFCVPLRVWCHSTTGETPIWVSYAGADKTWVLNTSNRPSYPQRGKSFPKGTWFNVWMVIDNNSLADGNHTVAIYAKTEKSDATSSDLLVPDANLVDANFMLPVMGRSGNPDTNDPNRYYDANGLTRFALTVPFSNTSSSNPPDPELTVDDIYVFDGENLICPIVFTATNPTPADGAKSQPLDVTFKWDTVKEANLSGNTDPNVTGHYLYYKVNAGAYGAPVFVDEVNGAPEPNASYGPVTFAYDDVVTWYIEEQRDSCIAGNPNNRVGPPWSFEIFKNIPSIPHDEPRDRAAAIGESVTLTIIDACDPAGATTLQYRWYKGRSGDANKPVTAKKTDPNYTIGSVADANFGYYWCMVSSRADLASNDCNLVEKMLLAHWKLDSAGAGSGAITDATGNGYNGTLESAGNPVTLVSGKDGNAIDFNTIEANSIYSQYIMIDNKKMNRPDMFTVTAWVKTDGNGLNHMPIFAFSQPCTKGNSTNRAFLYIELVPDPCETTAGGVNFQQYAPDSNIDQAQSIDSNIPITDNKWHFVAFTFNNDNAHIYIDGLHDANGTISNFNDWQIGQDANMVIGKILVKDSQLQHYRGVIDDVKLYNYAKNKTEIADQYLADAIKDDPNYICILNKYFTDLNGDCKADFKDFALFAETWLILPKKFQYSHLAVLAEEWLTCGRYGGSNPCPGAVLPYEP